MPALSTGRQRSQDARLECALYRARARMVAAARRRGLEVPFTTTLHLVRFLAKPGNGADRGTVPDHARKLPSATQSASFVRISM